MRRIISLLTALAPLVVAAPSAAQMFPGDDVIVNPAAIPPVAAPSARYPDIVLKPPSLHHRHRQRAAAHAASADLSSAPSQTAPPASQQAPANTANSLPFTLGGNELSSSPKAASAETAPGQTRKPAKTDTVQSGLTKRGAILFVHDATDPQPSQLDGIRLLAGDLNSAIEAGASRIQLEAFGGPPGDKSSDARRISLRRALAIRQLLIDNGVPSNRIDVRALGGVTDGGNPDRVDIYIRAG